MKPILCLVIPLLLMSGCANVPPFDANVGVIQPANQKIGADLKSITVVLAQPSFAKGDLPDGDDALVTPFWQAGLQNSLNKLAIFNDDSSVKADLNVTVLQLEIFGGFGARCVASAKYELIDRKSRAVIFSNVINSEAIVAADMRDGLIKRREAINGAVQKNVDNFLKALRSNNAEITSI